MKLTLIDLFPLKYVLMLVTLLYYIVSDINVQFANSNK